MDEDTEWLRVPAAEPRDYVRKAERARRGDLAEPISALDRLEQTAIRLAALQGTERPLLDRIHIAVFAADRQIDAPGPLPQAGTAEMVRNIALGISAISLTAHEIGAKLEVINLGTAKDLGALDGVLDLWLGPGSGDIRHEPAMTRHQLARAIHAGRHAAERARLAGVQVFIGDAVGIESASSAATLAYALLASTPERPNLAGNGLETQAMEHELRMIRGALDRHRRHLDKPLEALRRLGGFHIAALTGSYMACAHMGLPVLADGFACSVAALVAARLCPGAESWLLFAQGTGESPRRCIRDALDTQSFFDPGMDSEDGAGAAALVPQLRLACRL